MYKRKRAGNTITRKINSTKDTAAKADKNHYISNSYLEGFIPIDTEYFTASVTNFSPSFPLPKLQIPADAGCRLLMYGYRHDGLFQILSARLCLSDSAVISSISLSSFCSPLLQPLLPLNSSPKLRLPPTPPITPIKTPIKLNPTNPPLLPIYTDSLILSHSLSHSPSTHFPGKRSGFFMTSLE